MTATSGSRPTGAPVRHDEGRPTDGPAIHDEGGDDVCWLDRVCPECGGLADDAPPVRCPRCDTVIDGD